MAQGKLVKPSLVVWMAKKRIQIAEEWRQASHRPPIDWTFKEWINTTGDGEDTPLLQETVAGIIVGKIDKEIHSTLSLSRSRLLWNETLSITPYVLKRRFGDLVELMTHRVITFALFPLFKSCLSTCWCGPTPEETFQAFEFEVAVRGYKACNKTPMLVIFNDLHHRRKNVCMLAPEQKWEFYRLASRLKGRYRTQSANMMIDTPVTPDSDLRVFENDPLTGILNIGVHTGERQGEHPRTGPYPIHLTHKFPVMPYGAACLTFMLHQRAREEVSVYLIDDLVDIVDEYIPEIEREELADLLHNEALTALVDRNLKRYAHQH